MPQIKARKLITKEEISDRWWVGYYHKGNKQNKKMIEEGKNHHHGKLANKILPTQSQIGMQS